VYHFTHEDIVVAHVDPAINRTLDFGERSGEQRHSGDARPPRDAIEPVLPLAGKALREVLLIFP